MYYNFNPSMHEPLNLVHPIKLPIIKNLMDCEMPQEVDFIILFGSSLDLTCNGRSDIDLLVITEHEDHDMIYGKMREICYRFSKKYDIVISNRASILADVGIPGTLSKEIEKKAVCIYEK